MARDPYGNLNRSRAEFRNGYTHFLRFAGLDPRLIDEPGMMEHIFDYKNHIGLTNESLYNAAENAVLMSQDLPGEWVEGLRSFESPNRPAIFGGSVPPSMPDAWDNPRGSTTQHHEAAETQIPDLISAAADLVSNASGNHSAGGPGTSTAQGAAAIAKQKELRMAGELGGYDIGTGEGATPLRSAAATSTKGAADIAEKAASRGILQHVDDYMSAPSHAIGRAGEGGLNQAADFLKSKSMPNSAGLASRLAPVARWGAPLAAAGLTVGLPAVMSAMSGNEKAGIGGAVIEGGAALAGAAIGGTIVPFIGAPVGAMIGGMVGGGLASGAAAAVEKAQQGDTGFMGTIGRVMDPFVDTAFEKEQAATLQQMNSPAMQQIKAQEAARRYQAQADQNRAMINQLYAQAYH
jgi:hypothetical protein